MGYDNRAMTIYKPTAAILLAAAHCTPAQGFNGNQLYTACQAAPETFESGFCMGYIAGVVEKGGISYLCMPQDVTFDQFRDIVRKFLREHPERRHEHASGLVDEAHASAFPCR